LELRAAHRSPGHRVARRLGGITCAAVLLIAPVLVAAPASADASSQWPLAYLKASQVWDITKGSGATVAILDTGVAPLPDTQGSLLSGADFSTSTTSSGNGQTDLDGHGTGMAIDITGAGNPLEGFAPDAKILPVRVGLETFGAADVAAGIEYAVSQHVSVINLSLGVEDEDSTLANAVRDAENTGVVVVAATGNSGASSVSYPAAYPGVVAVGAVDQNGALWPQSDTGPQVVLTAPGVNVPSEDETGAVTTAEGTSDAAAFVSATVALIRADHPSWTAGQVIRDLISTADPSSGMAAGQHSDQYGYGIVDPLKALQASAPSQTSNPLLAAATVTSSPTATTQTTATGHGSGSSSHTGLILGVVAVVVVAGVVVLLLVPWRKKNDHNRPGGPGPGGPGYGGPQPPYGGAGYPQQNPYQQPPQGNPQPGQQPYPPQQQYPPRP